MGLHSYTGPFSGGGQHMFLCQPWPSISGF